MMDRERRRPIAALLVGAALLLPLTGPPAAAEEVTLALNWIPTGIHVPLFFAREGGYWSRQGLTVRFEASRGSGEALAKLVARRVHFALAETAALVEARSQGQPVVGVFLLFDRNPSALLALEGSGVRSLKDLAGRAIGAPRASFPRLLFPDLAQAAGLDLAKVKWKELPPGELLPSLLAGDVDAVASYTTAAPQYELAAKKAGKKVLVLPYAAAGFDPPGLALVTRDLVVVESPELVRRFAAGLAAALADALARPAEALKAFLEKNEALGPERVGGEWREARRLIDTPRARRLGLGRFDPEEVAALARLLTARRRLKPIGKVEEVFTNRFVAGAKGPAR